MQVRSNSYLHVCEAEQRVSKRQDRPHHENNQSGKKMSMLLNSKGNMRDSFLIIQYLNDSVFIPEGMGKK